MRASSVRHCSSSVCGLVFAGASGPQETFYYPSAMAKRPAACSGRSGAAGRVRVLAPVMAAIGVMLAGSAWAFPASAGEPVQADPPNPSSAEPSTATLEIIPDPESITSLAGYAAERIAAPVLGDDAYVIEAGPEDAPTLVLVHGVTRFGAHDWYRVLPVLAEKYRVLTFDLPGFHRSSGGNKLYSPGAYAEFVLAVTEQRRPGPFLLIGHSLGAAISIEIAARSPDRVKRLMLVDVAGILLPKAFYHEAIDRASAKLGGFARLFEGIRDGARDVGKSVPDAYAKLGETTILNSEWLRGFLMASNPSRVAGAALMAHDFGTALGRVKAPTLLVWGELDTIAPMRTALAISSRLGNAPIEVLKGVEHVPIQQAPERFNEAALAWLAGTGPETSGPEPAAPDEASEMDGECRSRRGVSFEGHYRRITIEGCRDVLLRHLRAEQIFVRRSVVKIESSVVESSEDGAAAITVVGSELTISGSRIRGAIAIESSGSELDLAGTTLEGSEASLHAREGSTTLLCSVCRLESPTQQRYLHDVIKVLPGTKY
jgi:pimeloyl-ACP methyl ester carboxylesterase